MESELILVATHPNDEELIYEVFNLSEEPDAQRKAEEYMQDGYFVRLARVVAVFDGQGGAT